MATKPREIDLESVALDATNRRILSALDDNARISLAELARRVGMSAPAVADRLARLEATGVIAAYRVEIDPAALGFPLAAVIRVRPDGRQLPRISDIARESAEVVWCHRITGEDCLILMAHLRSVAHLEEVIDRFTPFGQTTTSIVQSSPVPERALPV